MLWPKELKDSGTENSQWLMGELGGTKGPVTHLPGKNGSSFRVYDCPCPGNGWGEHLQAPTSKIRFKPLYANASTITVQRFRVRA